MTELCLKAFWNQLKGSQLLQWLLHQSCRSVPISFPCPSSMCMLSTRRVSSCYCVALLSWLPFLTNQWLCKWCRPPYHDDRPYWKPPTSGEDSNLRYIQEQNQKNLGGVQSMVYQDKLMTTLWKRAIFISPAILDIIAFHGPCLSAVCSKCIVHNVCVFVCTSILV